MKTKKVIVGAVAAAMLSLAVCPIAPAAAGEKVQISVSKAEVKAGEQFSVDVSLNNISAPGIQNTDFAVKYDSSLITITSVDAGALTKTGADSKDSTAGGASLFDANIDSEGYVNLVWSTGLDDSSYWLNGSGVFCTIKGTVKSGVADGTVIPLTVEAVDRETRPGSGTKADIYAGSLNADGTAVTFEVSTDDGSVTVGSVVTTTTTTSTTTTTTTSSSVPTGTATLRGDANCDKLINLADAVIILQSKAAPDKYGVNGSDSNHITEQGVINGDVDGGNAGMGGDGLTPLDALKIQKFMLKTITAAEL